MGDLIPLLSDEIIAEYEQEIIDGQQRITSLFLLLRAIYTKLQAADTKSKEAVNFINQIEPAIWRTNKLTGEVDYSNILLESRVVNNEGDAILLPITAAEDFEKNFLKFCRKLFADLLSVYLEIPTINVVKSAILKLDVSIIGSSKPSFEFRTVDEHILPQKWQANYFMNISDETAAPYAEQLAMIEEFKKKGWV